MADQRIIDALKEIAGMLEACSDDVPYELSAKNNLYIRMVDMANEAKVLIKDMQEQ